MQQLLNTLFVLTQDSYLSLENENVLINLDEKVLRKIPLINLEQINYFGYKGASPALMGECAKRGIALNFYRPSGRFLARVTGHFYGNVLLRKKQYRISDDLEESGLIARNFIVGKIYNSRSILERVRRDHSISVDAERLAYASREMFRIARLAKNCLDLETLRGLEGEAASIYFANFNQLILQAKDYFYFNTRNKRPPRDPVNALLSFAYTLLANDCAAALESVGLDPYVGFLHRDRPGRMSLALDIMEEFRSILADRYVLKLINDRMVNKKSFQYQENGSVLMTDEAKKDFLSGWQERKKIKIIHPFLQEKIPWGLVLFVQALLLSRYLRGDLDLYPCFMWK